VGLIWPSSWPRPGPIFRSYGCRGYTRDSAFSDGLMRDDQPFLQKPVADDLWPGRWSRCWKCALSN